MNDIFAPKDRHRSLNLNQTLEELLGFSKPAQGVEDVSRLSSPIRPPTRHGRDSNSSHSEQSTQSTSKDSNSPMNTVLESWKPEDSGEPVKTDRNEEFLRLLSNKRSSLTTQERRESLRQGETIIPEEDKEDEHNGNVADSLASSMKMSRPSSSSTTAQKTFRKGEKASPNNSPEQSATPEKKVPHTEKRTSFRDEMHLDLGRTKTSNGKPPVMMKVKSTKETSEYRPSRNLEGRASFAAPIQKNDAWLKRKREEEIEKKKKEKEAEEKKKQSLEERKRAAQLTFERWKSDYDERIKQKKETEKQKKMEKKKHEESEKNMKVNEAQKQFLAWKEVRIRSLSEERRKEKEKREKLSAKKENEKREKLEEAQRSFNQWVDQKKSLESERKHRQQELQDAVKHKDVAEKEYKSLLAQEAYETWLEIKEAESRLNSDRSQKSVYLPWVPPSNTVPRVFTPSGNRRRSLDRRARTATIVRMNRAASLKSIRSLK